MYRVLLSSSQNIVASSLLFVLLGCGGESGPARIDLQGSATFDGQPIPYGQIMFIPDSSKGNKGPAGTATIKDGKYSTVGSGKGIVGGPHTLRVSAFDGKEDTAAELPFGTPLFPDYELKADLPTPESGGTADFDVAVPKEAANPPKKQPSAAERV